MIFLFFRRFLIAVISFSLILFSIYLTHSFSYKSELTLSEKYSFPIIVIDAGHGGIDSGTSSDNGIPEKNINLSISKKLNEIVMLMGYQTKLTRTEDKLIGEGEYTTIRSAKQADIAKRLQMVETLENCVLISVHQNHFHQSKYSGFQVFYNNNHNQNKILAETLQKTIVTHLQPDNTRTIKTIGAEIYLLYHCTKPAMMVECGFLSNPKEVSLLINDAYQNAMAYTIAKGIDDALKQNPSLV